MSAPSNPKRPSRRPSLKFESNPVALMRKKQEAAILAKLAEVDSTHFDRLFKDVRNHSDSDTIDKAAFRVVMRDNGSNVFEDDRVLDSFWDALDVNKDHTVNKKELIVGLTVLASGSPEKKLQLSFDIYDFDRSGTISAAEFRVMMKAMGRLRLYNERQLEQWVQITADELFKKLDKDHNGELSREEFVGAALENPDMLDLLSVHVQSP